MPVKLSRAELKLKREEISRKRALAGQRGGIVKAEREGRRVRGKSIKTLERELVKTHLDQRLMRATDAMLNAQISLARGVQFLYRIDKTFVSTGKNGEGYYKNEKPVLVESQHEIELYLEELADNNGELSDDKDEASAYYFITTKAPDMAAIKDAHDRVHGRPKETVDVNQHHTFSLAKLNEQRTAIDGNPDTIILDAPRLP